MAATFGYLRKFGFINAPSTVPQFGELDSIFCGIDLPFADSSIHVFNKTRSSKFTKIESDDFLIKIQKPEEKKRWENFRHNEG